MGNNCTYETISDWKYAMTFTITMLSGLLSIILAALSGVLDANKPSDANTLKLIGISFGAAIAGLQVLATFMIQIIVLANTSSSDQDDWFQKLGVNGPANPDKGRAAVATANSQIGHIIAGLKKASTFITDDKTEKANLDAQITALDNAYSTLGINMATTGGVQASQGFIPQWPGWPLMQGMPQAQQGLRVPQAAPVQPLAGQQSTASQIPPMLMPPWMNMQPWSNSGVLPPTQQPPQTSNQSAPPQSGFQNIEIPKKQDAPAVAPQSGFEDIDVT
jgi:hypothetical protein